MGWVLKCRAEHPCQNDPQVTPGPRHQTKKEHKHQGRHQVPCIEQHKRKADRTAVAFPSGWPPDYPKQSERKVKDEQKAYEQWQ